MSKDRGFYAEEIIGYTSASVNFGKAITKEEAEFMVRIGISRWAICQGGVLTLVPLDYQLKDNEWFVEEPTRP